jgi:hypothetical protein
MVLSFVALLFSTGVISSYFQNSTSTLSTVNGQASAIPYDILLSDYTHYPTIATDNFTGQVVYIKGNISEIDHNGTGYRSCGFPPNPYRFGCGYLSSEQGWVVWNWQSSSQALKVPLFIGFIATCIVRGMNGGNLYLDSRVVTQY